MPSETESRVSSATSEGDAFDQLSLNEGEENQVDSSNTEDDAPHQLGVLKNKNFPLGQPKQIKSKLDLQVVTRDILDKQHVIPIKEQRDENPIDWPEIDVNDDDLDKPFSVTKSIQEISHKGAIYAAAFNHYIDGTDTQVLATGAKNIISIYEIPLDCQDINVKRYFVDDNNEESFFTVAWAYDPHESRHLVLAAGHTGYIKVIDPTNGRLVNSIWGHGESVNEIRTDPNNSAIFASVSKDNTVRLWNVRVSSCLVILGGVEGHLDQVISCDWSPDSFFLVSCGMDHSIRMWHLSDAARNLISLSMTLEGEKELEKKDDQRTIHLNFPNSITSDLHCDYVDCVRFLGWHIISKGSEKVANLFRFGHISDGYEDVYDGKSDSACSRIGVMSLPRCDVWFLKFDIDPALRWLAFGATQGTIYFFNILDRDIETETSDYEIRIGEASIRQVCFGAGGRILIAVDDEYTVTRLIRNTKSGRFEAPKGKHAKQLNGAADTFVVKNPEAKRRKLEMNDNDGMANDASMDDD